MAKILTAEESIARQLKRKQGIVVSPHKKRRKVKKKQKKLIGIYGIFCGEHVYIGQSQDLEQRIKNHKSTLRNGSHQNKALQILYDQRQGKGFVFRILEECPKDQLIEKEVRYQNQFSEKNFYSYSWRYKGIMVPVDLENEIMALVNDFKEKKRDCFIAIAQGRSSIYERITSVVV